MIYKHNNLTEIKINEINKGFTLIEMLVAVAIFTVIVTIALTGFLNIMDIQNKAGSFRAINDNLNFALDAMSREIRVGRQFCNNGCGPSSFSFVGSSGCDILFDLGSGQIRKTVAPGEGGCASTGVIALTAPEVTIENLLFLVRGEETLNDEFQPMVTISIRGTSGVGKTKSSINLQTTISQRIPDKKTK